MDGMEGGNFRVKNGSPGSCVGGRIAKAKRDVNKIFQKFCRSFSRSSCTGVKAAISAPGVQRFRTIHHRPQFVGAGGCAGVDWERIRDRCVSSNFHPKSRGKALGESAGVTAAGRGLPRGGAFRRKAQPPCPAPRGSIENDARRRPIFVRFSLVTRGVTFPSEGSISFPSRHASRRYAECVGSTKIVGNLRCATTSHGFEIGEMRATRQDNFSTNPELQSR